MTNFEVYSYDVWGNEEDGWEVNAVFPHYISGELPDDYEIKDVHEFIRPYLVDENADLDIDITHEDVIYINLTNGYPVCELRRAE